MSKARLELLIAKAKSARESANTELLCLYPAGSEIRFTIMHGQRRASTGQVLGIGGYGPDPGYLRVRHHQAKPGGRYEIRHVHHTDILS